MIKRQAVFLDRDGTINEEVGYLDNLEKLRIIPGAFEAVRLLKQAGLLVIVITNQSGIARGFFDEAFVRGIHRHMKRLFREKDAVIDGFYYCPHHPEEGKGQYLQACSCRKPEPGMLIRAAQEMDIDLEHSYIVGDTLKDVEAGQRAGCQGVLVRTGYGRNVDSGMVKPDHVAKDILAAAHWILKDLTIENE